MNESPSRGRIEWKPPFLCYAGTLVRVLALQGLYEFHIAFVTKKQKISSLIDINLIMNSEALKSRCRQEWHLPISVERDSVFLFAAFLKLIAYS